MDDVVPHSGGHKFTFPPFPKPPAGVEIVSFKDFQEWGPPVKGEDGIERDGKGIQTLGPYPVSKNKKKKKNKAAVVQAAATGEWWAQWEKAGDHPRFRNPYETSMSHPIRLHTATEDFERHYAILPLQAHPTLKYLKDLFDAVKKFVGQMGDKPQIKLGQGGEDAAEPLDDDEDDLMDDLSDGVPYQGPGAPADETSAHIEALEELDEITPGIRKAQRFLDDPEHAVKLFLSYYLIESGQMWDPKKLLAVPRMMRYYLTFLFRTGVISKSDLDKTLVVVEQSAVDLPGTSRVSPMFPDNFGKACARAFGLAEEEARSWTFSFDEKPQEKEEEEVALPEGMQLVKDEVMTDIAQNATEEPEPETDAWGGDGGGWGEPDAATAASTWGEFASGVPPPITLESVFGADRAAQLQTTLKPGLAEASTRRVVRVNVTSSTSESEGLAELVLAPWPGFKKAPDADNAAHQADNEPRILRASKLAPAHDPLKDEITLLVAAASAEAVKPYVGIGLTGIWVRMEGAEKGFAGKWYTESMYAISPSYWCVE
ncbi:hypothetical protein MKEN_01124500 [Mycena kentingensis (nom. inval.)]|nr:hypothetical protein MKEN_01124500 [Mycena kentingensis (nom. inval.)]